MGALVAITPVNTGVSSTGAAVAASDTIAQSVMGPRGATLEIINAGAGTDTITISDNGATAAGNQLPSNALTGITIANGGASKVFDISPEQVNPATGLVTITHSQPTGVTYKLYPNGL
jgi:hypothetical protein